MTYDLTSEAQGSTIRGISTCSSSILVALYRIAGKFGRELNLAVWRFALQPLNYFILAYIRMAIPYRTTNIFVMANWGPTAKLDSRQYF